MNTETTLQNLMQNDARQDERLKFLENREQEHREMLSCMHKMNANVEMLTQRVKENSDIIKENVARQTAQNDELRRHVDESIRGMGDEMDERFKVQGERIGNLSKKPGERAEKGWETIKAAAITALVSVIITAVVTYFLINLGPY